MLKALLKLFLLSAIFLQPSTSCLACKLKGEINETLGGDAALANAPKGHDKSFIVESSSHSHLCFFLKKK
jgi:hypothetical protein